MAGKYQFLTYHGYSYYCKNPKNLDTRNICGKHPKIQTRWFYRKVMHPKDADGMTNSVDPDKTAPLFAQTCLGAVWFGSTLFAQTGLSEN